MNRQHHVVCALVLAVVARSTWAAPPRPTSLNNCQNAVKTATKAFVTNKVMAIGTCLQAVSTQIVKNNAPDAHAAAGICVTQFRRINDSRGRDKQLSDKLAAAIVAKCDPSYQTPGGSFPNTHTIADIIGSGAGVGQPLDAENLNTWCSHFGGDGAINTLQEWIDCLAAAAECDVDSTIASQYPRALEWLNLVKPSMQALAPPATDPTKITDAVAGLDAVKAEIDGADNDNVVSIQCGGVLSTCGDGVKNGHDACDGSDLGGETCTGLGYASGTLSCTAGCVLNVSGCTGTGLFGAQRLQTGQISSYGTGSDGDLQKGLARSYTDNGDGTITDNKTGLMWEKKSNDGTIHDQDNGYTWGMTSSPYTMNGTMVTTFLATLNGGGGFAGHTDWRIPNVNELQSIVNYENFNPSVDTAFNTGCVASCTVTGCSCTQSAGYWSSSTLTADPYYAWFVTFSNGVVYLARKSDGYYMRAVRGGS